MIFFSTLSDSLEKFRKEFPMKNVFVEDNQIIYRCAVGYADVCTKEANQLIAKLKLPLKAESNSFRGMFTDSFVIKKK